MTNEYIIEPIALDQLDENEFNSFPSKSVFTTIPWIHYIEEDSNAVPIILRIKKEEELIGYFTGALISRFGIKILGSPFNGWSTCFMGLDTIPDCNRLDIIEQVVNYAYKKLKCKYIEITDRFVNLDEVNSRRLTCLPMNTLELNINQTNEELFSVFKTDARNFIRQFERRGATIEIAEPNDIFAEEYYSQLKDVFAKQQLVPTYSLEKVKILLKNMKDTDSLLCLRVRNPEGTSIATSIFFGYKERFFFWGGASYRREQHYRPNEYMIWCAIQYWRDKGCTIFDMVGVRDYKRKFGPQEVHYAKLVFSKNKILLPLRNLAKKCYFCLLSVKGKIKHKRKKSEAGYE